MLEDPFVTVLLNVKKHRQNKMRRPYVLLHCPRPLTLLWFNLQLFLFLEQIIGIETAYDLPCQTRICLPQEQGLFVRLSLPNISKEV